MLELKIDQLQLNIDNAAGHEHRVRPIVGRALSLAADRVNARWGGTAWPAPRSLDALSVPPISLDLGRQSDEQAADHIAEALVAALALKLRL